MYVAYHYDQGTGDGCRDGRGRTSRTFPATVTGTIEQLSVGVILLDIRSSDVDTIVCTQGALRSRRSDQLLTARVLPEGNVDKHTLFSFLRSKCWRGLWQAQP